MSPLDTRHKCRDTLLASHGAAFAPPRRPLRFRDRAKPPPPELRK